jgi:hypothetical protein
VRKPTTVISNLPLQQGETTKPYSKIEKYNTFLPQNLKLNKQSTVQDALNALDELKQLKTQGRGLTDRVLKHFREDNNDLLKLKKGFNRHLQVEKIADGYSSSSDSSMEGKGVKKAFKAHRIKLGKGISIPEIPKYREFGKFIVHYPQLIDSNILNLKFPSTGTIPHIKPVYVEENFKEFIIDTLNTGRVNNRHFDSLTEPEKSHFTKIARGAKLTEKLNLLIRMLTTNLCMDPISYTVSICCRQINLHSTSHSFLLLIINLLYYVSTHILKLNIRFLVFFAY